MTETNSLDTEIIEVTGPADACPEPLPVKVVARLIEIRQQYIDAGLIPNIPLPPGIEPPPTSENAV